MNVEFALKAAATKKLLKRVEQFAKHPRKGITAALFAFDRKIRDTFQGQKDPWGKPWQQLKPATLQGRRRKGRNRTAILIDTAKMFRSLDREVTSDNQGRVSIGTEDRPVVPHLLGAKEINLPARPMMPIKPPGVVSLPSSWRQAVDKELKKALDEVVE